MNLNRRSLLKALAALPLSVGGALAPRLANLTNLEMWLLESGRGQIPWPTFSRLLQVVGAVAGRK